MAVSRMRGALLLLLCLMILPSVVSGDEGQVWEGFSGDVNYNLLIEGYNAHAPLFPELLLTALEDERVIVYFYERVEGVQGRGTWDIVGSHSFVFESGLVVEDFVNEVSEPTLYVYLTEEAFYELATGRIGLLSAIEEGSLEYDAVGFFHGLKLWWLKRGYNPEKEPYELIPLYEPPQEEESVFVGEPDGKLVESCASSGAANVLVSQMISVKDCADCDVGHVYDSCEGKYTLIEWDCEGGNLLKSEMIDCLALNRICFEGACVRDTSKSLTFSGQNSAERFLALSSRNLSCYESDNGMKTGERGIVVLGDERFEDFCLSSNTVLEFWCEADELEMKEIFCTGDDVCFHGACRAAVSEDALALELERMKSPALCVDSDGGDNAHIGGTVTVKPCLTCDSKSYADICLTSGIVQEQYCTGRFRKVREESCPEMGYNYCSNGECVNSPTGDTAAMLRKEDDSPYKIMYDLNKSGQVCYKHRLAYSISPGDEQESLYFKACEACNHTQYTEDCYLGNVYEFDCSAENFPEVRSQSCLQDMCYKGECLDADNLSDIQIYLEEGRHEDIDELSLCYDSDGGMNKYDFGRVEIRECPFCPPKSENHMWFDSCVSDSVVMEQFCTGNGRNWTQTSCPAGRVCSDGRCALTS